MDENNEIIQECEDVDTLTELIESLFPGGVIPDNLIQEDKDLLNAVLNKVKEG